MTPTVSLLIFDFEDREKRLEDILKKFNMEILICHQIWKSSNLEVFIF